MSEMELKEESDYRSNTVQYDQAQKKPMAKIVIKNLVNLLADPGLVASLQRLCGVEYEKPPTCDQQTQTKGDSSDSDSNSEHDEQRAHPGAARNTTTTSLTLDSGSGVVDTSQMRHRRIGKNSEYPVNNNTIHRPPSLGNGEADSQHNHVSKFGSQDQTKKLTSISSYQVLECRSGVRWRAPIVACKEFQTAADSLNHLEAPKSIEPTTATPSTPAVRIKYKFLLYLAYFGAFLGNEEFYLIFFPFGVWNLDSSLIRKVALLWCIVMYIGQATKDKLRWPRPPCPPVVRLETHYSQEYSMPSTHAMAGTAIPVLLAIYVVDRYQVPWPIAACLAVIWFLVTCWSRLYLGVHTVLDLLVGTLYALVILLSFLGYVEGYDFYQQTHPFAAPLLLITALALCTVCYPSNYKNSSKGDAVQIVAALTGVGIGCWLGFHTGYLHPAEPSPASSISWPTLGWCGFAVLRFAVGVVVLALLYTATRWLSIHFFSYVYGLDGPDKTFPAVMTAYKFTTYTVVGVGITLVAPLAQLYLGIHRPTMFYEV